MGGAGRICCCRAVDWSACSSTETNRIRHRFPLTDEMAQALLGGSLCLVKTEATAADRVPLYRGLEGWQEWGKPV